MSSDAEHTDEPATEGQIDDTKAVPNGAKVEQMTEVSKSSQGLVDTAPASFLGEANHLTQQQQAVLSTKQDLDLFYDLQLYLFQENAVDVSASVENQQAKNENLILRAGSDITLQRLHSNAMWPKLERNVEKLLKSPSIRFSIPITKLAEYLIMFAELDKNTNNELDTGDSDPTAGIELRHSIAALRQVFMAISGQPAADGPGGASVSFPEYVQSCEYIKGNEIGRKLADGESGKSFLDIQNWREWVPGLAPTDPRPLADDEYSSTVAAYWSPETNDAYDACRLRAGLEEARTRRAAVQRSQRERQARREQFGALMDERQARTRDRAAPLRERFNPEIRAPP
ncbi:unnamed protein product [Amoebophrya sp. A120]|nr:unnamed protein product [Amoebophrya sp. A120]|eukprot:GSA120T00021081001.1